MGVGEPLVRGVRVELTAVLDETAAPAPSGIWLVGLGMIGRAMGNGSRLLAGELCKRKAVPGERR